MVHVFVMNGVEVVVIAVSKERAIQVLHEKDVYDPDYYYECYDDIYDAVVILTSTTIFFNDMEGLVEYGLLPMDHNIEIDMNLEFVNDIFGESDYMHEHVHDEFEYETFETFIMN